MKSRSIIKVLLLAFGIGAWVFLTAYILPVSFAMFKMFERLWPITSIKARGTAIYYSSEGKISYPLNLILESPNKYRLEIETPEGLRVEIQKGKHFSISHNKRVVKRGKRKEHLLPFLFTRSAGTARQQAEVFLVWLEKNGFKTQSCYKRFANNLVQVLGSNGLKQGESQLWLEKDHFYLLRLQWKGKFFRYYSGLVPNTKDRKEKNPLVTLVFKNYDSHITMGQFPRVMEIKTGTRLVGRYQFNQVEINPLLSSSLWSQ